MHNSAVQSTENTNVSFDDNTHATSQGDANATQNDSATLASDDNDTLDPLHAYNVTAWFCQKLKVTRATNTVSQLLINY